MNKDVKNKILSMICHADAIELDLLDVEANMELKYSFKKDIKLIKNKCKELTKYIGTITNEQTLLAIGDISDSIREQVNNEINKRINE